MPPKTRPKRHRPTLNDESSDHESDSSEDEAEHCAILLPDPNNSGCSDNDSETEEYDDFIEKNTFSRASKNYSDSQTKLEPNYVYEWVDGEKKYPDNVENQICFSEDDKKKFKI